MTELDKLYEELKKQSIEMADLLKELRDCRNELCLKCGAYEIPFNPKCSDCRWKM